MNTTTHEKAPEAANFKGLNKSTTQINYSHPVRTYQQNVARAEEALFQIPPNISRYEWLNVAMAAKDAGLDFETFHRWSSTADNYHSEKDCFRTWNSFKKKTNGISESTLFFYAQKYGWKDSYKPTSSPDKTVPTPPPKDKKSHQQYDPVEIFNRCVPATNAHPYIQKKQADDVPLDGLRVIPAGDPLRIVGESMSGSLVVPCIAIDGTISSLLLITPPEVEARLKAAEKPGKLNLPGCKMQGWFTVGTIALGGVVHIVEGIGQAWACWQATGDAAVVCFGAGNIRKVAQELRQLHSTAKLVLVPDVGKESDAEKIARECDAYVAPMPDGWDKNSDVNDLIIKEGRDALTNLLASATKPVEEAKKVHPLAQYIDIDSAPKPPSWVIHGFIGQGVTVISGAQGIGKTSSILPLSMIAAGLFGDELMPHEWRHVVYISEDVEQAKRILLGITKHSRLNINHENLRQRLHLVSAQRLEPAYVATVGTTYREKFTRQVQSIQILPLVVIDTKSAVLAVEDENDNSQASAMMAALKQGFDGLPVWLIGHVAKSQIERIETLSSRGASAIEADANQTMYLIKVGDTRYLKQGKTRFEPKWYELMMESDTAQISAADEFGNAEPLTLRWNIPTPSQQSRAKTAELNSEKQDKLDRQQLRQDILDAVKVAWDTNLPLNKTGLREAVKRNKQDVFSMIHKLICEHWIHEVEIPKPMRLGPSKVSFLIKLETEERDDFLAGKGLPEKKLVIPDTWKKPVDSLVPEKPKAKQKQAPEKELSTCSRNDSFPKENIMGTGGINEILISNPTLSLVPGTGQNEWEPVGTGDMAAPPPEIRNLTSQCQQ